MKLAVNFSSALLGLLQENPDLPVDYIKVPTIPFPQAFDQFEQGAKFRKLLPHPAQAGVLCLGHHQFDQCYNPEIITEIIERTQPQYLSTHLEVKVEYFPELRQFKRQDNPVVREGLRKRFLEAIRTVKEETGLPLVVENFPYYKWGRHFQTGAEPDFIAEICEAGDCGFLLDIAHARCSAWHLNRDWKEYLFQLPLHRLREIHLAGTQMREEGMRDTHTVLEDEDYRILHMVLAKNKPEIISIEYGGMPDRLLNLKKEYDYVWRNNPVELAEMINRVNDIINQNDSLRTLLNR